jgi:hypothetical protein
VMHGDDAEDHDDDDDGHCCLDGLVGPWGRA